MATTSTKERIAAEFYSLTYKKNIDKITVKDVVDACDISRQSFYYHFRDLPDVMEWTANEMVNQTIEDSMNKASVLESLEAFFTHFYEYRHLIKSLFESSHRIEGEQILFKAINRLIGTKLKERLADVMMPLQDYELLLDYHTFGIVGILVKSISQPNFSAHNLAVQINRMMERNQAKPSTI
ncbi:TetR/AcrR family transcriptional regulator [Fundicoccus culcitae]|uniref:TetR/AcrR family transcriptional regulator n=1 Tax=Fundicoccus culcitae TaxID=2969821 RepID=A0ABY5P533_9LACT|nr:TetR/AcrR family transcriptional regulator [Fundicoccus culcitae]UUX33590.1 TetR/AcrR family transcriptional regulator [Fundicoccus culcitae]